MTLDDNFLAGINLAQCPMLVLLNGLVAHVNPAAQAMMRVNPILKISAGVLHTSRSDESAALKRMIGQFERSDPPAVLPRIHSLRSREGFVRMILTMRAVELAGAGRALIIQVADLHVRPALDHGWLAEVFTLTKAEARVVASLFAGNSVSQTMSAFFLSHDTVRGTLKRAMVKLGVRSQAEMMLLLQAAHSSRPI